MRAISLLFMALLIGACESHSYCEPICDNTIVNLPATDPMPGTYRLHGTVGTQNINCTYVWEEGATEPSSNPCVGFDPASGQPRLLFIGNHEPLSVELTRDGTRVYKLDVASPQKTTQQSCTRDGCTTWTFDPPSA